MPDKKPGPDCPPEPKLANPAFVDTSAAVGGPLLVEVRGANIDPTPDVALWEEIRKRTNAMGFARYKQFADAVLCGNELTRTNTSPCTGRDEEGLQAELAAQRARLVRRQPIFGMEAYELLRAATEVFLIRNCGIDHEELRRRGAFGTDEGRAIESLLEQFFGAGVRSTLGDRRDAFCSTLLLAPFDCPCMIELIWSYWHEEGMLVQTVNAIALRFQNRAGAFDRDPLANLEIGPLRPVNHLIWGYIQDEHHRLSVPRRAYEYDHHYGITIAGKAVPKLRPADSRSKFLESFHQLLYIAAAYYKERTNTLVNPDGFPILNALKETHMILAEGMHNQYGDLPWTARVEMLMQQWILARPELREFLHSREMIPYAEPWMAQVDAMKSLQGWIDTSVRYFHDLAVFGEQILLSIRFGNWNNVANGDHAKNWAESWKPEVQAYIHAYRAATGVDLSEARRVDTTQPSILLTNRIRGTVASVKTGAGA